MLKREDICYELQKIILRVTDLNVENGDISLFSSEYNLKPDDMANIILLAQSELGFIVNTNSVDACEEFSISKIVDSIIKYNINLS